jgi:hypothetical protein
MYKRIGPITLDGEAADRITLLNLKEYKSYLTKELTAWRKNPSTEDNPDGVWLHPEDVTDNMAAINALNIIIKHFKAEE